MTSISTMKSDRNADEINTDGDPWGECNMKRLQRYPWLPPGLNDKLAPSFFDAFNNSVASLSAPTMFNLFLALTPRLLHDTKQDSVLRPLLAAANLGYEPAQGVIPLVYRSLEKNMPDDVQEHTVQWLSKTVATGSTAAASELQTLDPAAYQIARRSFRDAGGYLVFYSSIDTELYAKNLASGWSLPELTDTLGNHVIHYLAANGKKEQISKFLRTHSVDVNAQNTNHETALYIACLLGSWDAVNELLDHGADPSIPQHETGITCLHWLFNFDEDVMEVVAQKLLQHGAHIDALSKTMLPTYHFPFHLPAGTPLHWAVATARQGAIRALLNGGASATIRNRIDPYRFDREVRFLENVSPDAGRLYGNANGVLGLSPLDAAVQERQPFILQYLKEQGIQVDVNDVDEEGYSAFHRLDSAFGETTATGTSYWKQVFRGDPSHRRNTLETTIRALQQLGGDINKLTSPRNELLASQTPLMLAMLTGSTETVAALLDCGADPNITNERGQTAMHHSHENAREDGRMNYAEVARLLLAKGYNVSHRDHSGWTALRRAADRGGVELVGVLLEDGAELLEDNTKQSPGNDPSILAYLAPRNSKPHPSYDEKVASLVTKHVLSLPDGTKKHLLLEYADPTGGSLLYYVAGAGMRKCVKTLLDAGVQINPIRRGMAWRNRERITTKSTPLDAVMGRSGDLLPLSKQGRLPRSIE